MTRQQVLRNLAIALSGLVLTACGGDTITTFGFEDATTESGIGKVSAALRGTSAPASGSPPGSMDRIVGAPYTFFVDFESATIRSCLPENVTATISSSTPPPRRIALARTDSGSPSRVLYFAEGIGVPHEDLNVAVEFAVPPGCASDTTIRVASIVRAIRKSETVSFWDRLMAI